MDFKALWKGMFNPDKDTGEKKPIRAVVAARDPNDRFSSYPSDGLTPTRLAAIFKEADEGNVWRQMELFEEMEEKDPHLFSQLQTRKLAVTGLDWEVQPFSKDERDCEIADFVQEQLQGLEGFPDIMMDMMDAVGKGISICEIMWGVSPDLRNVIDGIEWVHPKKLIWDGITDEMRICTSDHPQGLLFPKNKFVIHRYKAKSGHPSRAGVLRVCAWMYLFKNYDVKDWVAFCEVFGMPIRIGKYDPSASEDDKAALMKAIIDLGSDAAGIMPNNTEITFVNADKTSTVQVYELLARYCDEQMSKAVLGQTLTSGTDGGGSYALGKTHGEVRHDLTVADAVALAATIRRDIIRPLVEYNYGSDAPIPLFGISSAESGDLKELMEIYKGLIVDMGLPISKAHIYKKFNIPAPETDEEVLERPQMLQDGQGAYKWMPMKARAEPDVQQEVDRMEQQALGYAEEEFRRMMQPLMELVRNTGSPQQLLEKLQDEGILAEVYEQMQDNNFDELMGQATYLSHLLGRVMD